MMCVGNSVIGMTNVVTKTIYDLHERGVLAGGDVANVADVSVSAII